MAELKEPDAGARDRDVFVIGGVPDGYTLRGKLTSNVRPPLTFAYRPAMPDAVYTWRMNGIREAENGKQVLAAAVTLLKAHVVSWSVQKKGPNGHNVPYPFEPAALDDPAVLLALGQEYIDGLVNHVCGYVPGEWETDAKNS